MKKRCYVTVLLVMLMLIMPCGQLFAAGKADKELKSLIANKKKKGTVSYEVGKGDKISAQTIKAAKDRPVTLVIDSKAGLPVTWNILEVTEECDFDPAVDADVSIPELEEVLSKGELSEQAVYTEISFAQEGILPGKAEVIMGLSVLNKFKGADLLYLYYFNPETKLFERTDSSIYQGNTVFFYMTHCSDYLIINEKLPPAISDEIPEATKTETEDSEIESGTEPAESESQVEESNDKKGGNTKKVVVLVILVLILAAVIVGVVIFMKKTQFRM